MSSRFVEGWRVLALLVFLCLGSIGCHGEPGEGDSANADEGSTDSGSAAESDSISSDSGDDETSDAIPVEVVVLERGPMEAILKAAANLEAENQVMVVSEAARRVREILVEEGMQVRRGQVLLRLQNDEQQSQLERTRSQLAKAQREFERQEGLHGRGLATDRALSDATYELDQAKINFSDAERGYSYTEIRAPIAGTVTQRLVNLGDQVQLGQSVFEIIDFNSLVARIFVPEKNLNELADGQRARVFARALSSESYEGSVLRISPVVDPRSGTVKVTVAVGGQEGLRPGLYVDVALITRVNPSALRLPKRALVYDNDMIYAFRLVTGSTVERLPVIPLLSDRDYIEPMSGFAEGDSVIVAGQASLKGGSRVEVVDLNASSPEVSQQ